MTERNTTIQIPRLVLPRDIHQHIVKSRFGYHVHTTYGIMNVGEAPLFAFTRKKAERKAQRLADRIRRNEQRRRDAQEIVR